MGLREDAAERFAEMAALMELLGESRFRINSYAKAARVLEAHAGALEGLDQPALTELDGIGASTADKILELAETGAIAAHQKLVGKVPEGLLGVMQVPGVGPKTAKLAWDNLEITDLDGIRRAIDDGSLATLKGLGPKSVENIRQNLSFASKESKRLPLGIAMPIAEALVDRMSKVPGTRRCAFAGSLRRGKESIGDLDLLVVTDDPERARAAFCEHDDVQQVVARGETKCSVRLKIEVHSGRWRLDAKDDVVGADLRIVPEASWGAALMYFTGSKDHNVRVREAAIRRGFTLNEYGLFEESDEERASGEPPQERGTTPAASETEAAVFAALELPEVAPELREDAGEVGAGPLPELITVADIRAELHAHTTESDGRLSLDRLVQHAIDRGFHTIAVTDHSRSSVQANGLSVERLKKQRAEIEALRETLGGAIDVLCGSEVDIHADGSLDYDDDVLAELDYVIASPHTSLKQEPARATERLLRVIEHPLVHVVGHPTGRLVGRRKGLEPAMDELVHAAAEHNTALEINSHWMRLDLRDTHVRAATAAGAPIAIDCDVHTAECFDNLRFGVVTGRRGWLTAEGCVNAWDRDRLRAWIRSKWS
ncbi:MAG: DNA polymerase/3'-5' exonuclease PolX [Planctomycetota bacterium]